MVVALTLTACNDVGCETPRLTLVAPDQPPAVKRLTVAQYRALERLYERAVALDAIRDAGYGTSPSHLAAAAGVLLAACRQLDAHDPLLGPQRRGCFRGADVARASAGVGDCPDACAGVYTAVGKAIERFVAASHAADRAVQRAGLAPACTSALVTSPSSYDYYEQLAWALRMLERALDGNSGDKLLAAAAMGDVKRLARSQPTHARLLSEFRAGCA